MNDYIDRAALKKRFQKRLIWLEKDVHNEYSKGLFHGCETDMSLIDEIPAADIMKVKHGRWIHPHWRNSVSAADCSECGAEAQHIEYRGVQKHYKICPSCGARMDKGAEHVEDSKVVEIDQVNHIENDRVNSI